MLWPLYIRYFNSVFFIQGHAEYCPFTESINQHLLNISPLTESISQHLLNIAPLTESIRQHLLNRG